MSCAPYSYIDAAATASHDAGVRSACEFAFVTEARAASKLCNTMYVPTLARSTDKLVAGEEDEGTVQHSTVSIIVEQEEKKSDGKETKPYR